MCCHSTPPFLIQFTMHVVEPLLRHPDDSFVYPSFPIMISLVTNVPYQISLDLAEHLVLILKDNNHRIVLLGVSCLRQIAAHLQQISKPLLKYARARQPNSLIVNVEFCCQFALLISLVLNIQCFLASRFLSAHPFISPPHVVSPLLST